MYTNVPTIGERVSCIPVPSVTCAERLCSSLLEVLEMFKLKQ